MKKRAATEMKLDTGVIQAVVIVLGLFAVLVVCSLFKSRPNAEVYSPGQLEEIRIRRESEKEDLLEDKAKRLQERARIHRHNRLLLTARKNTGVLLQLAQEQWDARGRTIYGDAWDLPESGNMPLRTLFDLPKEEIDSVRDEAKRLVKTRQEGWSAMSDALPTPPAQDNSGGEHIARTASARRGSASYRQSPKAPFIDPRFVYTPDIVPPLDFTRLRKGVGSYLPVAKHHQGEATAALHTTPTSFTRQNHLDGVRNDDVNSTRDVTDDWHRSQFLGRGEVNAKSRTASHHVDTGSLDFNSSVKRVHDRCADMATSLQKPGLLHSRPPDLPVPGPSPPTATRKLPTTSERESLSAHLARLVGGGNSGRVLPLKLV